MSHPGWDIVKPYHISQDDGKFKTYELFTSGISRLTFLNHGWPLVTSFAESKTKSKEELLYNLVQGNWGLESKIELKKNFKCYFLHTWVVTETQSYTTHSYSTESWSTLVTELSCEWSQLNFTAAPHRWSSRLNQIARLTQTHATGKRQDQDSNLTSTPRTGS